MTKQDELTSRLKILRSYLHDHRDQMISDLKKIIEIPSPSEYGTGTDQVGDFLISRLNDLPFKFEKRPGGEFGHHLIVECTGPKKPIVLFCGHMDTVFPLGSEWSFKIENGRAYGPGVIDMKSGLITLVYACRALEFSGGIPVGVRILFNSDEEMGSTNSKNLLPELANGVDFGIIMEPAEPNGDVIIKRKGIGKFEISVTGREAHAGKSPETGINAILEIAHKIVQVQQLADKTTGTTINTGFVEGGRSPYIVPALASAMIEGRVWTLGELRRVQEGMKKLSEENFVPGSLIQVKGGFHRPPLVQLPKASLLIDSVASAAQEIGISIGFGGSGAASDGNNLTALGIATIDGMGPVGGREHSSDEYLELGSLFERTLLLAVSIINIKKNYFGATSTE